MPGGRNARGSVEECVRSYLKLHMDAYSLLKSRLANISKLSRDIMEEYPEMNASSIRYSLNKIMEEPAGGRSDMSRVDRLIFQSKVTLQDKVTVITSPTAVGVNYLSATYLSDSVVYIVDETKDGSAHKLKTALFEKDVSLLHIFSSKEIEKVPGFVMRITERLFSAGINILQLISCSNETLIVVRKTDGIKAYETLVA